jgi:hypothetical protein
MFFLDFHRLRLKLTSVWWGFRGFLYDWSYNSIVTPLSSCGAVVHWYYVNDFRTTHAVVCYVTALIYADMWVQLRIFLFPLLSYCLGCDVGVAHPLEQRLSPMSDATRLVPVARGWIGSVDSFLEAHHRNKAIWVRTGRIFRVHAPILFRKVMGAWLECSQHIPFRNQLPHNHLLDRMQIPLDAITLFTLTFLLMVKL